MGGGEFGCFGETLGSRANLVGFGGFDSEVAGENWREIAFGVFAVDDTSSAATIGAVALAAYFACGFVCGVGRPPGPGLKGDRHGVSHYWGMLWRY